MGPKKSADGIVGSLDRTEGQNMTENRGKTCVSEVKKKQKTGMRYPVPIQKIADGIRKEMEKVHQTLWQQKTTFP
jgi:hypothetical protein